MADIGWAVQQMRDGRYVRRAGWNGKGMWLALCGGYIMGGDREPVRQVVPHVLMRTVDDTLVPWLCSQTDLLANDWELVE